MSRLRALCIHLAYISETIKHMHGTTECRCETFDIQYLVKEEAMGKKWEIGIGIHAYVEGCITCVSTWPRKSQQTPADILMFNCHLTTFMQSLKHTVLGQFLLLDAFGSLFGACFLSFKALFR